MGKIVAVSCSPRTNGSSARLSDAFLDGAMGLSTNIVELYRPMKFRSLNDCSRCMACKTSHKCVIDDDIRTILESIRTSDCVVFSTPVFFNGPSALYKLVEDRMFSFLDKERNSVLEPGKKAVLIVTGCNPESRIDEVAKILANNLETIGFEILGVITYCDKDGKGPIDENDDLLVKAKKLGQTMRNTPTV